MICVCGRQGLAPRAFLPSPSILTTCLISFIGTHNKLDQGAKPTDWHALCYTVRYAIGNGADDVRGRGTPSAVPGEDRTSTRRTGRKQEEKRLMTTPQLPRLPAAMLFTPECETSGCHVAGDKYTMVRCRGCGGWF